MQGCGICPLFISLHEVTLGKGLRVPVAASFDFVCFFLLKHNSTPTEIMVLCRSSEGIAPFLQSE